MAAVPLSSHMFVYLAHSKDSINTLHGEEEPLTYLTALIPTYQDST